MCINLETRSMTNKISILIPSTRPDIYRIVNHLERIATDDYEIIISSPCQLSFSQSHIKVISDDKDNVGSIDPINQCFKECTGDYFMVVCDDLLVHPNVFKLKEFLDSPLFENRKYPICSIGYRTIHDAKVPTYGIEEAIQNVPIMSFPAGKTDKVRELLDGVIFNESYKHICADNWLSYFIAQNDGSPIFMLDTRHDYSFDSRATHSESVREHDRQVFIKHMAEFHTNTNMSYNHRVTL